jgi:hypothetical protein
MPNLKWKRCWQSWDDLKSGERAFHSCHSEFIRLLLSTHTNHFAILSITRSTMTGNS